MQAREEHHEQLDVTVRGLSKSFPSGSGRLQVLTDIDLTLEPQTFTAVMGPSGSGKSMLLNCLLGLEKPDAGSVRVGGREVTELDEDALAQLRRTRIGVVFQAYNLVPSLTVADNISLPLRLAGARIERRRVRDAAAAVGLDGTMDRRPAQLSGGQQQRVALARALITEPELIVADEPTGALDSSSTEVVLGLLRSLVTDLGQRALMVTHDARAAEVADRVLFLSDGRWCDELRGADAEEIAATATRLGRRS